MKISLNNHCGCLVIPFLLAAAQLQATSIVQFSSASYSFAENESAATILVGRAGDLSTTASVDYMTEDGTATAGSDYVRIAGTLNFAAGESVKSIQVPIFNDGVSKAPVIFTVVLKARERDLQIGMPGVTRVSLHGPQELYLISKGSGTLRGTWSFDFEEGREAVSTWQSPDIWWEQLTSVKRQMVPSAGAAIINLGFVDFEAVSVTDLKNYSYRRTPILGDDDGANLLLPGDVFAVRTGWGSYSKTEVLRYGYSLDIRWETYSELPFVTFENGTHPVGEAAGQIHVTLLRRGPPAPTISVNFTTLDDTAVAGLHYAATQGRVTFAAGEVSKSISIPILNDRATESNKKLRISLSSDNGSRGLSSNGTENNCLHDLTLIINQLQNCARHADFKTVTR